ncbi:MAG: 50S ribosomal protein L10 [Candidatus Hydrogenedentes bacterium]|nr:50S ribosomal protein L10 [Candidatus Hydrogenedentota bacterium]
MPNPEKIEAIAEFKERVEKSEIVVAAKYIGINAEQATELRSKLREGHVEFKVFKNTLVKRALDELGLSEAAAFMDGPTAWAFCDDPVAPAKTLKDFGKEVPAVDMNGGILSGKVVSKAQLDALASLPSRDVLVAQVVGTVAAPLRNLVGVLSAPMRNLANVLDQIRKQKEEAGAAA